MFPRFQLFCVRKEKPFSFTAGQEYIARNATMTTSTPATINPSRPVKLRNVNRPLRRRVNHGNSVRGGAGNVFDVLMLKLGEGKPARRQSFRRRAGETHSTGNRLRSLYLRDL